MIIRRVFQNWVTVFTTLWLLGIKTIQQPLWGLEMEEGGESGVVVFEMCCVLFYEINSLA